MTQLHDRICAAIGTREARWFEGLAADLAAQEWKCLARLGIDSSNYGTARVLRGDPTATRMGFAMRVAGFGRTVSLERYDSTMLARYGVMGLREPRGSFDPAHFEAEFARAMGLIDIVPGTGDAVRALVWSVTPVDVEGPEYDTSYSDPAVPFSVFIGAHPPADRVPSIRLAEGLLHETMHLQLSLIENLSPLVCGSAERRHSPWQGRQRPTQGILHGLYVFRVIQDWLRAVVADSGAPCDDVDYARGRIVLIESECSAIAGLRASEDLTADGRRLATSLM